jgi:hypothetical protein
VLFMLSVRSVNGVAVAMKVSRIEVNRIEDVAESVHYCLLTVKFVNCHGRCNNCSVDYLRSRLSAVGAC